MLTKFSTTLCSLLILLSVVPLLAQNAQITVSGGVAQNNFANKPTMGVELRYGIGEAIGYDWVVGLRASTTLQVPTRIERVDAGSGYHERTDGSSTVNTLMFDIGTRSTLGVFQMDGGVSVGGVNMAHQRVPPPQANLLTLFGASETITQPSFAFGGWLTLQVRIAESWMVGVGGTFDYSEHRRTVSTNAITGVRYDAVFAGIQTRGFLTIGRDLGVPKVKDSSGVHCWLIATITSVHPFSNAAYNQFNPGVGLHVRFAPQEFTWFAEAAAYQYSLGDRAVYAGGGVYKDVIGKWLKMGVLAGMLTLGDAYGTSVFPAVSPRITAESVFGSASVVFIPVGSESAFGLTVMLPLF